MTSIPELSGGIFCQIRQIGLAILECMIAGPGGAEPVQHYVTFDICARGQDETYTLSDLKDMAIIAGADVWSWGEAITNATPANDLQLIAYSQFGDEVCCQDVAFFTSDSLATVDNEGVCSTVLEGAGSRRNYLTQGVRDLDDFSSVTLIDGTALNVRLAFVACADGLTRTLC